MLLQNIIVRFLSWVLEVLAIALVVVLFSCIHNHSMDFYAQGTSEHILNNSSCTKMFETKSVREPVRLNSKSFLDLCEPRKVKPWHWKRCLSQCWCPWVPFLWQAGIALEFPKRRTNIQDSCPAPAGRCMGGGSWAFQSWLFLQSTVVTLFPSLRLFIHCKPCKWEFQAAA